MSFGGDDPQVIETGGGVYEPAEPYVKDIMSEAARLYASDVGKSYYPGSTVIPFAPETQAGLDLSKGLGFEMTGPSRLFNTAETALGGFATGVMPDAYMNRGLGAGMGLGGGMGLAGGMGSAYTGRQAYGELAPQADYLRDVRAGISSDVMGDIASQFGGQGRTGTSPAAQQAAARGFTQAYAPIAQSAAEAERARELSAREADIVRQQQASSGQLQRMYGGTESQLQRMYGGSQSQLDRQYGASQADIARQQQARESGIARMMQGAQALPGLQQQMDERRLAGISGISGVGSAYEDLAARNLQDRINRFQFEQQAPYQRLSQFASPIFSAAGMQMPGIRYAEQANPLTSAFGLAEAGYGLGSQFGYGGLGAILGGLGGLLG